MGVLKSNWNPPSASYKRQTDPESNVPVKPGFSLPHGSLNAAYDPRLTQNVAAQDNMLTGPPVPAILQCPRTASSGRRLIVVRRGGSYGFFSSFCSNSRFIQHPPLQYIPFATPQFCRRGPAL